MAKGSEDLDSLWPHVYEELRRMARARMRSERRGHTLDPTGLVHEVYLRFQRQGNAAWTDRRQFFAHARVAMRRILIEYARERNALIRWGHQKRVTLETAALPEIEPKKIDILTVDEALSRISESSLVELVELRFFCGLTVEEIADLLGESKSAVEIRWRVAKGLLVTLISGGKDGKND